jgi:hypothetical protein
MDKPKTTRTKAIKKPNNVIINDDELFTKPKKGKASNNVHDMFNEAITTTTTKSINKDDNNENAIFKKTAKTTAKTTAKPTSKPVTNSDEDEDNDNEAGFKKNGYVRPDVTYTDQLSKEQIEKKLEDYKKVEDIMKVPLGVHLRYFSDVNGKLAFRMGGQLHKNTGLPEYVILSNGTAQWSVQVKNTIFYRKMVLQEIKEEYEKIILEQKKKIKDLKDELRLYKK